MRTVEGFTFPREGKSLYSSHMLDLSEEPIDDNLGTCKEYFQRMNDIGMTIEIELGVTGGEEDGVDNTDIDSARPSTINVGVIDTIFFSPGYPKFDLNGHANIIHPLEIFFACAKIVINRFFRKV